MPVEANQRAGESLDRLYGPVFGMVVDDDDLEGLIIGCEGSLEASPDSRLAVPVRNDYRDKWCHHPFR